MSARIRSAEEFYAHALAIEREAEARYRQLADQMLVHNNPEVAQLFERMARLEGAHHARLHERARSRVLHGIKPREYQWADSESPDEAPLDPVHHPMSAHQALRLALANERRAQRFFAEVADAEECPAAVRELAATFSREEAERAAAIESALAFKALPVDGWNVDFDPPVAVD